VLASDGGKSIYKYIFRDETLPKKKKKTIEVKEDN